MIAFWHAALAALPFEWAQYAFMRQALLAVLLITPLCGLLGTLIVNNRMAFFADSIGHGALAGLAAAVLLGLENHGLGLVAFAALFAIIIVTLRWWTHAANDTLIAAVTATAVAGGIVVLSRGGGFAKYTRYLIGDILGIAPHELVGLGLTLVLVVAVWLLFFNRLLLVAFDPSLARSRGIRVFLLEALLAVLAAVVIAVAIPWVGLFIISALLVLPAAAARNIAGRAATYHLFAVAIAVASGVAGLLLSYLWGTATGATIVLVAAGFFLLTILLRRR